MQNSQVDTIIIGGGMAGLTAATLLAKQGRSVAVYEQSKQWGGRAITRERNGFHMNLGPHAVYRGFSTEQTMTEMGITLKGAIPAVNRHAKACRDGQIYALPAAPASMVTSKLLSFKDKIAYAAAALKIVRADAAAYMDVSWHEWSEGAIANERVRAAFTATGRIATYGNYPARISAGIVIRQLQAVLSTNVLYLDGGWQQMVDAVLEKARAAGVQLHGGCGVASVVWDGVVNQVTLKDGRVVSAETLIVATAPAAAAKLLDSDVLHNAISEQIPVKAACLTLALNSLPNPEVGFAMGIDEPLYYSQHSAVAELAPAGKSLVHLAWYHGEDGTDAKTIRTRLESFMEQLQPGWRAQLIEAEYLPSITVYHALPQYDRPRPPVVLPDRPNAYVIGYWVDVNDILLDASITSAKLAVAEIMKLYSPERVGA